MKIYCIIITYNPEIKQLENCIKSLTTQVDEIIVVDNSENYNTDSIIKFSDFFSNVRYCSMRGNVGIAQATNEGLIIAQSENADWVITSDQDSVFPDNYVKTFKDEFHKTRFDKEKIAGICPIFYDRNSGQYGKFCYKQNGTIFYKTPEENQSSLYQTIASGLFINVKLLEQIGLMASELFIDLVDHEWCWRVNSKGYLIVGCKNLIISHSLGESSVKVGKYQLGIRNPIRLYYYERNYIYLSKYCDYLTKQEKKRLKQKALKYLLVFPLITKPHIKSFIYMVKGLKDGINKCMGKIDTKINMEKE